MTPVTGTFDASGKCAVQLPRGQFCFEAFDCRAELPLIALRSDLIRINRDQTVYLRGLPPQEVTLDLKGFGPIPLVEFAIRYGSAIGEQVWRMPQQDKIPKVIVSKGQSYYVRLIGQKGSLHTAVWKKLRAENWAVKVAHREMSVGKFVIRDDGPKIEKAGATFAFPDSQIAIEQITEDTRFVTNRKFFSYAYWFKTKQQQRVLVHPQLGTSASQQTYFIGGEYKPVAWACVMKAKHSHEKTTTHFLWGADLVDSYGHIVDVDKSAIDWKMTGRTPEGEIKENVEINEEQKKLCSEPHEVLRVDVSYNLGQGPINITLVPVKFQSYSIPGFETSAPPHWQLQAANYIAKARRVYGCIEEVEGKPGDHTTTIQWHNKTGIAWGTVGGKKAWIMMPFRQLQNGFDHYATPWALPHEMLHNFKYNHGEKMNATSKAVGHKLELFRWYMADHPTISPEEAFPDFRRFQRNAPWDVR